MNKKINIFNRHHQRIVVLLDLPTHPQGLAFIAHGLGGFKEQSHIHTFAEAFIDHHFVVVRFDCRNTIGESEGSYEDATITSYYEDLEDVIGWAKTQPWYRHPFYLAGHSLGGISILLYTERHPHDVKGLAPISTTISGTLTLETKSRKQLEEWSKTGWQIVPSVSKPSIIKKLKWNPFVHDLLTYDILPDVPRLTMPVLLITGEKDESTPPRHQQILYDVLPGNKEFHIIHGAPHTFRGAYHLQEIKELLLKWIEKVESTYKRKSRIIIVDQNDKSIGFKEREALNKNDLYRVSALWITNSKGDILLARRSHTKSHDPRKWGPAVAGTVEEGESYKKNILKEAEEELGLKNIRPHLGPKTEATGQYHYFTQWFTLTLDKEITEFRLQAEEVEEIQWFSAQELKKQLEEQFNEFLPTMKNYFKLFVSDS